MGRKEDLLRVLSSSPFHGLGTGNRLCAAILFVACLVPVAFYVAPTLGFYRGSGDDYRQLEILSWYKNRTVGRGGTASNKNQSTVIITTTEQVVFNKTHDGGGSKDVLPEESQNPGTEVLPPNSTILNSGAEVVEYPPSNMTLNSGAELVPLNNKTLNSGAELVPSNNITQNSSTELVPPNNATQNSSAELAPLDNTTQTSSSAELVSPALENKTQISAVETLDSGAEEFWKRFTLAPRVVHCANFSCASPEEHLPLLGPIPAGVNSSVEVCPDYFKWIREDLAPWAKTGGVTRKAVEEGMRFASFRVAIVGGKLYVEAFSPSVQTRGLFTVWGLLQLLRQYPGQVPDVEFAFSCVDRPVFRKIPDPAVVAPPLIFRYCSNPRFFDIPFPDWSFWGWPEIDIRRWDLELADILEGSKAVAWANRTNVAYWKGNPYVANIRKELLKCNSSDFNAQIFIQDWIAEEQKNFTHSKLGDQCKHRYKIYAEGYAWSVSLKYIVACNSPVLLINPEFHDFILRGLRPKISYLPVSQRNLCKSIEFAVDWGNAHPDEAEKIGKVGQDFISQELDMGHVYDYMLHMLTEYAKLQRFKPSIPKKGVQVCTNSMICLAANLEKPFLEQSLVNNPSTRPPCHLPSIQ